MTWKVIPWLEMSLPEKPEEEVSLLEKPGEEKPQLEMPGLKMSLLEKLEEEVSLLEKPELEMSLLEKSEEEVSLPEKHSANKVKGIPGSIPSHSMPAVGSTEWEVNTLGTEKDLCLNILNTSPEQNSSKFS